MHQPRLYHDLAHLWPLLSPPEHYLSEAESLREIMLAHPRPVRSILELGAGAGHWLCHLAGEFDMTAVDLSEEMLDYCRKLNPEVPAIVGDMRTVRLDRTFDAVVIHDAVDYMTSRADVLAALRTAAAHLPSGGLALVAPTYTRETLVEHELESDQHESAELTVTYACYVHDPDPADETFELVLVYFIRHPDGRLDIEQDRHTCGLFSEEDWLTMLGEAGFDAEVDEVSEAEGSSTLFVATKR